MKSIDWVRRFFKGFALVVIVAWSLGLSRSGVTEEQNYVLATATVGGTYYPVGVALATLLKAKLGPTHGIAMTAIRTAGSGENIQLLREKQAQFALVTGLDGYYAWIGEGPFVAEGPQTHLRSVTALWRKVEHFVIKRRYAKTGTIEDMQGLRGKKVSLGLKGAGALETNRLLLGNLGFDIERDFDLVYLGFDASARALQRGEIEAMSMPTGVPVSAVTLAMLALGDELVILEFTDAQLERVDGGLGLWTPYVIEAGTYPAQNQAINTIATLDFLAVRADTDEEAVYQITKAIYENLAFLQIIHKALSDMSLEKALTGLPVPLHPGALRYYREVGLDIPDGLIAKGTRD